MLPLTNQTLLHGLDELSRVDPDLAGAYLSAGAPPLWVRPNAFATLVKIVLEQQVSLASAEATYRRLAGKVDPLTPDGFLRLGESGLREIGFSRQKTLYTRSLAESLLQGDLELEALEQMPDDEVMTVLTSIKGIGPWTAGIYLMMALKRPDIWPVGDLALASAAQAVKRLPNRPNQAELAEMATAWSPWRAVAARLLWHYYRTQLVA